MVKNMCFLIRDHMFKFRGVGYVHLYRLQQSNHSTKKVPCPTNKGISYTKLMSELTVTLKLPECKHKHVLHF
jgi:hypothetical protein